jgi:dihydrofolate synthase/folylpolyglutamate synthase
MVKDKDIEAVLNLLPKNAHYYFTQSHLPRALVAEELAEKANAMGLKGDTYSDVNIALETAAAKANDKDLILVIGSIYLVAEVNRALFKK